MRRLCLTFIAPSSDLDARNGSDTKPTHHRSQFFLITGIIDSVGIAYRTRYSSTWRTNVCYNRICRRPGALPPGPRQAESHRARARGARPRGPLIPFVWGAARHPRRGTVRRKAPKQMGSRGPSAPGGSRAEPWQSARQRLATSRSRPPSGRAVSGSAGRRRPARPGRSCHRCRCPGRVRGRCRSSPPWSARPGRCRSGSPP